MFTELYKKLREKEDFDFEDIENYFYRRIEVEGLE